MNPAHENNLQLRFLAEPDLPLLHKWLNAPHLKPFYMQDPISAAHVHKKFTPRITGTSPCRSLIVYHGGKPFGYIQWYFNRSFPEYGPALIDEINGISFDYFIGSVHHIGQGLGSAMLNSTIRIVSRQIDEVDKLFFVGHQLKNEKAISCSKRAGFSFRRNFIEKGFKSALYLRSEQSNNV